MAEIGAIVGAVFKALSHLIPQSQRREREQFENVYAPMRALFLTRHVTVYVGVGAPKLRHRMPEALRLFKKRRYRWALRALLDKKRDQTAEVEYGRSFPRDEIHRIVKGNEKYCDAKLLNLIARADRSRYEEMSAGPDDVTEDELALVHHISNKHTALSRKFVGR